MLKSIRESYRESARVALALPLLAALPFATELIQHLIEFRIGMYASVEAMQAVGEHPARMGFGYVKVLSLVLLLYWVSRWLAFRCDAARRVLGDWKSALLFTPVVLLGMAISLLQLYGGALLSPFTTNAQTLLLIGSAFFLLSMIVEIYLIGWKVGAALGNARLSIPASVRVMHGNFWWSLSYFLVMTLPLISLHYTLGGLAVGRGDLALWTLLTLDALVVAYLGLVLATTTFIIARRAAERASVPLAAQEQPSPA